jgi:FtsH-binding integral membrane protein
MTLDLEEKILNGASLCAFVCVFFPWVGGEWLGGKVITYSGLGFFTSFIGVTVLLLHLYILLITIIPLTSGPTIVKRKNRDLVRLLVALFATVLTVAIWSVLTKFTFEFSRLQIHFGLYGTLIGSVVCTLYAFLRYQETTRSNVREIFDHPEPRASSPKPPPSPPPEDHGIYR